MPMYMQLSPSDILCTLSSYAATSASMLTACCPRSWELSSQYSTRTNFWVVNCGPKHPIYLTNYLFFSLIFQCASWFKGPANGEHGDSRAGSQMPRVLIHNRLCLRFAFCGLRRKSILPMPVIACHRLPSPAKGGGAGIPKLGYLPTWVLYLLGGR